MTKLFFVVSFVLAVLLLSIWETIAKNNTAFQLRPSVALLSLSDHCILFFRNFGQHFGGFVSSLVLVFINILSLTNKYIVKSLQQLIESAFGDILYPIFIICWSPVFLL